jgi:hypothetical protein
MWGFVIVGATLAATATSTIVLRATRGSGAAVTFAAALIGAYAVYELVLLAATPFLSGRRRFYRINRWATWRA